MKAKILFYDIETSPNLAYVWGKYQQDVIAYKREWQLLSFAYKWKGEPEVTCHSRRTLTEKELVIRLRATLEKADIIVAHNGDDFDYKKANAKFLEFGLDPLPLPKSVDTKKVAKNYFKFNSNSLNDLGQLLKLGKKINTGGFDLWLGCMGGDAKSWSLMERYNKQDVLLLEKVYNRLLPWMMKHPNVAQPADGRPDGCPKCGGLRLKSHGWINYVSSRAIRYRCKDCGGWCQGTSRENLKDKKAKYK